MPLTETQDTQQAQASAPPQIVNSLGQTLPREGGGEGSSASDFLQIESIVLNLDASLRVHARSHFFSWTQGLLQTLIRHELLICTLCNGKPPAFRADGFSMNAPDPAVFSDMFMRDSSVAPALLKGWEERRFQPLTLDLAGAPPPGGNTALHAGPFARELQRLGATQLLS